MANLPSSDANGDGFIDGLGHTGSKVQLTLILLISGGDVAKSFLQHLHVPGMPSWLRPKMIPAALMF